MDVHRQAQLRAFFEHRIHARVVDMNSERIRGRAEAPALVTEFADAQRTGFVATFQFRDRRRSKAGLMHAAEIKATPHSKAIGMPAISCDRVIEPRARVAGENDRLFQANFIHRLHPVIDTGSSRSVVM